jgi:short subunit fatty acids transporter
MDTGEVESRRKLALKLTWISAITLLIGGPWAWFIVSGGGPEALGAILPLMVVGGVHLLTGPIAIYQAFRIRGSYHCVFVYAYYAIFLFATALLFPRDIFTYIIFFVLVTIVPILFTLVVALFKSHER